MNFGKPKIEIKYKVTEEVAHEIFYKMKDRFGFNVSEAKIKELMCKINGMEIKTSEESDSTEDILRLIREGRIEYNEESEKLVFHFARPVESADGRKVGFVEFGDLTFSMEQSFSKSEKVPLSELHPARFTHDQLRSFLQLMTGCGDDTVFNNLTKSDVTSLRYILNLFFE